MTCGELKRESGDACYVSDGINRIKPPEQLGVQPQLPPHTTSLQTRFVQPGLLKHCTLANQQFQSFSTTKFERHTRSRCLGLIIASIPTFSGDFRLAR